MCKFNTGCVVLVLMAAAILFGAPDLYPCRCPSQIVSPSLPNPNGENEAVFVGIVTDAAGDSLESMLRGKGWLHPEIRISDADWNVLMETYEHSMLTMRFCHVRHHLEKDQRQKI